MQNNQHRHSLKFTADDGSIWLDPIYFKAGQTEVFQLILDFKSGTVLSKDWAITAWGTKGSISVNHVSGIQTDHLADHRVHNKDENPVTD